MHVGGVDDLLKRSASRRAAAASSWVWAASTTSWPASSKACCVLCILTSASSFTTPLPCRYKSASQLMDFLQPSWHNSYIVQRPHSPP